MPAHNRFACLLIRIYEIPHVFRVQPMGQRGRTDEVAKQHTDMPALRLWPSTIDDLKFFPAAHTKTRGGNIRESARPAFHLVALGSRPSAQRACQASVSSAR